MPDLGSVGSAAPVAFQGGAVSEGSRTLPHVSTEAFVSSDAYPAIPILVSIITSEVEEEPALTGSIQVAQPIIGSVDT